MGSRALGAVLGVGILFVRRIVPESPRWLFIHGRDGAADEVVRGIERQVADESGRRLGEWTRRSPSVSVTRSASARSPARP
jgi:hypothetical protein